MAEATEVREYRDDLQLSPYDHSDVATRQKLTTPSWQVVSIPDNVRVKDKGSYIAATQNKRAHVALNVYTPRRRDEMHCHPGSEHIFMVWEGHLTIRGINEGEDVVLKPGEFVHINQSYYYQLANESDQMTVIYSVFTKPPKPAKISRYSYRGADGVDPTTLEGE